MQMGQELNMKVVILAGGYGTRISEESQFKPKPMIEIGGMPILWHIMKSYSYHGFNDFIICAGYKQHVIKQWFADYALHTSDVTFDFTNGGEVYVHERHAEPWKVAIVNTGIDTMTGGRVKRIQPFLDDESFMLTYGDGVCDVDMEKLLEFHKSHGKNATITAVEPGGRFGVLDIEAHGTINNFGEKKKEDGGWINGGYMVLNPEVLELIDGDDTVLEKEPLERLATSGELMAYKHNGFWQCMDTLREKQLLDSLINSNKAPWMKWQSK